MAGAGSDDGLPRRLDLSSSYRVRLFEADNDLLCRTPPDLREALARHVTVPVTALLPGSWEPLFPDDRRIIAFLVLDGMLSRETRILGERAVELLGPGDPMRPPEGCEWTTLPYKPSWQVGAPTNLAILDEDFEAMLSRMPGVAGQLVGRAVQRSRTLAIQLAICGVSDLGKRLLVMLWHLADRWGRQEEGHVRLDLALPHEVLADLVRARRPSVSVRLKDLCERGLLARRADGQWLLPSEAPLSRRELTSLFSLDAPATAQSGLSVPRPT